MGWTLDELHAELAEYYARFKGIPAPETTYSLSLWHAIDLLEGTD